MKNPIQLRDDFKTTVNHINGAYDKLRSNTGKAKAFSFADAHKLTEGLLLSAWTHWEEFIRELLILDVASDTGSALCSEVKKFRVKAAPMRIAERMVNHPDHPDKYVNWDFDVVKRRADALLPSNHRFSVDLSNSSELSMIKRIRNGIAHKSDKAWDSFKRLVKEHPFSLTAQQLKGITVGRFLYSNQWNNANVLKSITTRLLDWADQLVP